MRVRTQGSHDKAGFTLLEIMITLTLIGLVTGNLYSILGQSSDALSQKTYLHDTEVQARRTLDRITEALLGASQSTLYLTPQAPFSTSALNFESNLGVEEGEVVWSDPERVDLQIKDGQIVWAENPDTKNERSVIWSRWVPALLEGEVLSGEDDNDNGLIDEGGLSFELAGNSVIVRLTIEKTSPDGQVFSKTLESVVTCRN